ncbi:MAG TPA: hypothetical protein VNZ26_19775 [Vicinamibacterales bacterium]|jgi:hypothetical protein|nr:hypothetical protein [Vicinamibacterales bacterium]
MSTSTPWWKAGAKHVIQRKRQRAVRGKWRIRGPAWRRRQVLTPGVHGS